jgi:hypothetical protein
MFDDLILTPGTAGVKNFSNKRLQFLSPCDTMLNARRPSFRPPYSIVTSIAFGADDSVKGGKRSGS